MAFLIPALCAVSSDVFLLYLNLQYRLDAENEEQVEGEEPSYIVHVRYLAPLAVIRLLLVAFPLAYHSYTGTAIKFPGLYHLLYITTILLVLGHTLSIIMLDPRSITSFLPTPNYRSMRRHLDATAAEAASFHASTMRHVWVELSLTMWSTLWHCVLLWHVRSTAPDEYDKRKRALALQSRARASRPGHVLYYYASQQHALQTDDDEDSGADERGTREQSSLLAPATPVDEATRRRDHLTAQRTSLPDHYDDFVSDLQKRLKVAKQQWTERLEEVSSRMSIPSGHPVRSASTASTATNGHNGQSSFPRNSTMTPFRVLLHLFAYEEVLSNNRLDAVFEMDGGDALTFYVPQLLSFLLYGAYHNSPTLEQWILEKCQQNIHFAHRCYWFLRAWCLQQSPQREIGMTGQQGASNGSLQYRNPADAASNTSLSSSDGRLRLGSSADIDQESNKLLPEERHLIEALLLRVIECGELPATFLQYGTDTSDNEEPTNDNSSLLEEHAGSPSALMSATESGMIPVDPINGFPSVQHMDSVAAQHKYGFLPLERHDLLNQQSRDGISSEQQFFMSTPRFLDALTTIADNLFLLPREHRLGELRRQLRSLEIEFLPSNAVYLPVNDAHHRVWRIVADESIAISTKERVPCIIYLEVVDYEAKKPTRKLNFLETALRRSLQDTETVLPVRSSTGTMDTTSPVKNARHTTAAERDTIDAWQQHPRDPQRQNSIFDKVSNFTQKGLQRLRTNNQADVLLWRRGDRHSWGSAVLQEDDSNTLEDTERARKLDSEDIERGDIGIDSADRTGATNRKPPLAPSVMKSGRSVSVPQPGSPPGRYVVSDIGMGQWSSPTSLSNMERRRKERMVGTSTSEGEPDENAMGALAGIRSRMETHERSDSIGMGDAAGPEYGTARRSPAGSPLSSSKRSRPPPVVFRESFAAKEERVRSRSAYGSHPGWRLLPILIKSNDDLRQEQLASQLIYRMASILAREKIPVWICAYEIVAMTNRGGIIEAIPDTISIDSLKRNDPHFTSLNDFFLRHFGEQGSDDHADAKACFVESLAAYSMVCYLLQIKDRHNGNILVDSHGHLIHIDFGFFFLSSPGKNSGFESAPFKLTRDFVDLMDGPDSRTFRTFRELCCRTFLSLRRHWYEIIILVEMLMVGNEDLPCFRGRPEDAVKGLRERFRLDLNDRACTEYVNALVDDSLENWRTRWYDRYQRYCVGVL